MALEYPYPAHPEPGTTVEIVEGVRWLTMPMGGSLTHINLYLLEDADGWFVVDTGLADGRTKGLWHGIFDNEMGGKPVKGVICTHMHPDHTGQAGMIVNHFRCPLYMTRAEYYQARTMMSWGFSSPQGSWTGRAVLPPLRHAHGAHEGDARGLEVPCPGEWPRARPPPLPNPLPMGYHRLAGR